MKVVKTNTGWVPSILNELLAENRLDVPNYENFSSPAVNISENLSTFVIEMAVPGIQKELLSIEIEKEQLKVSSSSAPKQDSADTKDEKKFSRKEFNFSNFERSFTVPKSVSVEEINASYKDGILTITLPKKEEKKDIKKMVEIS